MSHTNTFHFFAQRTVNVWNSWPDSVDLRFLNSVKRTSLLLSFNELLSVYKCSHYIANGLGYTVYFWYFVSLSVFYCTIV